MEERAKRYSRRHIASCEHWQDGLPVKCWRGQYGVLWQVKNAHVYKPPAGLTDKQRLSSELDKILSCDISCILKIKMR